MLTPEQRQLDSLRTVTLETNSLLKKDPFKLKTLEDIIPFGVIRHFKQAGDFQNLYGWEDYEWSYSINEYNHRDKFNLQADKKIAILGSSDAFGAGVEFPFASRLQNKLPPNYSVLNFGTCATNILVLYKKFIAVTELLDLDTVIMAFPSAKMVSIRDQQFKVLTALTNVLPHTPEWVQLLGNLDKREYNELHEDIKQGKEGVPLQLFLMQYIDSIVRIAVDKKIKLVLGSWDTLIYFAMKQKYPEICLPLWEFQDHAICDSSHPGQASHDEYTETIYQHLGI